MASCEDQSDESVAREWLRGWATWQARQEAAGRPASEITSDVYNAERRAEAAADAERLRLARRSPTEIERDEIAAAEPRRGELIAAFDTAFGEDQRPATNCGWEWDAREEEWCLHLGTFNTPLRDKLSIAVTTALPDFSKLLDQHLPRLARGVVVDRVGFPRSEVDRQWVALMRPRIERVFVARLGCPKGAPRGREPQWRPINMAAVSIA